jgi:hypothetical protein
MRPGSSATGPHWRAAADLTGVRRLLKAGADVNA